MRNPVLTAWRRRPWLPILLGAAIADSGIRVLLHFESTLVLPIEAGILGGAGAFILALSRRGGSARWGELALAAALGLGALRALLWGVGVVVWQANLVVLAMGIICAAVIADRRNRFSAAARAELGRSVSGVPVFHEPSVAVAEVAARRMSASGARPVTR